MDKNSLTKGILAGTAAGLAMYAFSSANTSQKNNIKKDAGKALKAAESLIQDITSVFM